ncbi:MAG: histidine kinase dimerization/phosphoacceptor domain -containing protein, partial [Alkalispirochaeta sp.]
VADFYRAGTVVSDLMPVPVFAMWDFFMGTGVAGGFLVSGREQGRSAAEIVQRILSGTSVEAIPVQSSSPNRWIFDMEPLRIAGVTPQQIPPEAVRYNETHSVWREYRTELSWLAALVTVMGTLIVLLMQSRRTRAVAAGRLQDSLREKEILLKEIHHRVKNNLQVISSILSMQREFISDQQSLDYFKDCETRVQSMALVHEQLYQTESLAQIHLPTYLEELLSSVYSSVYSSGYSSVRGAMNGTSEEITVRREVADLSLLLDQAIPVGLMVNELVSNALKYAYPEATTGPRIIALTVVRVESDVQISVRDWGIGLEETVEHTDSLGLQLVHALTSQLHGVAAFEAGNPGLRVRITFPLGDTVGDAV